MIEMDFLTIIIILLFSCVLFYRISYLNTKVIGYFSLLQIFYFVAIPSIAFILAFKYLQSILQRPYIGSVVLPDFVLVNIIFLSFQFIYGGLAIHAVTKMLKKYINYEIKGALEMQRFFQDTFSHNIIYFGGIIATFSFALLELNHNSGDINHNIINSILKGIILGSSLIMSMFWYQSYGQHYQGKWSDLKLTFFFFWICYMLIIYSIFKINPSFENFDMLLPVLVSFSLVGLLSLFLVMRRFKRRIFLINQTLKESK